MNDKWQHYISDESRKLLDDLYFKLGINKQATQELLIKEIVAVGEINDYALEERKAIENESERK